MIIKAFFKKKLKHLVNTDWGAVAVIAGLAMASLVALSGLVYDVGHLTIVKTELQRAADAAALAGARALASYNTPNTQLSPIYWNNASPAAWSALAANRVDGLQLSEAVIEVGYWNLEQKIMQATSITPTVRDVPAVRVTLRKAAGENGGPVPLIFGPLYGRDTANLTVQSLAALPGGPGGVNVGDCFPLAVPETFVRDHWNSRYSFKIYSDYHTDNGGQWTSFLTDENNVPYIRNLIDYGNPDALRIGDEIYIQPGTKASLYGYAASKVGQVVMIVVVADDFLTHEYTPIKGFVAFYVEATNQGEKWIQGHFEKDYVAPQVPPSPEAPFFGTYAGAPKLVQ